MNSDFFLLTDSSAYYDLQRLKAAINSVGRAGGLDVEDHVVGFEG